MHKIAKLFATLSLFGLLAVAGPILAEAEVNADVQLDEEVTSQDLETSEPSVLPDSPFYFLKDFSRDIRTFFTFNNVSKAELRLKFSNERLLEARKLAEKTDNADLIRRSLDNYQSELEKIKDNADRIKGKAKDNPNIDKFLNKFTRQQILHEKILSKLERNVPEAVLEKITEARERHLERFGQVMTKLEDREDKIQERLETNLEEIDGSKFKNFKNLEILINLEEKLPENAREAIKRAQENSLKRLHDDLENMSPEDQARFNLYIQNISGTRNTHLEIIENLKAEADESPAIQSKLLESRNKIIEKIQARPDTATTCKAIEKPETGFCANGRVIASKDEGGCVTGFQCVTPSDTRATMPPSKSPVGQVCITLWDPVCGNDGKTYSNSCFAKIAGIEISHKGGCQQRSLENLPAEIRQ